MYNIFDIFDLRFNSELNELFNAPKNVTYPTNVIEYDDKIELEIAAIGKDINDINLTIEDYVLHISTNLEKKASDIDEGDGFSIKKTYLVNKIKNTKFDLVYQIGNQFDIDKIEAKMKNGLLTIVIPKKENYARQIEIKSI
jgi:HSP20 family protein